MRTSWLVVLAIAFTACDAEDPQTDDFDASEVAKLDPSAALDVRVGDTTVWADRWLQRHGNEYVLHGRTSRTLIDGRAFVFDDIYGDFAHASPRTYDVRYATTEIATLLEGVNLFVGLDFVHSSGRPDSLTARAVVRPRLSSFVGPSSVYVTAELTPVIVAGRVVYRVKAHTTKSISECVASNGTVHIVDPTHLQIDLERDDVIALTAAGAQLSLDVFLPGGGVVVTAKLGLALKTFGLTMGDAYAVWRSPTCTTATRTCLLGLPDGALDLGSCGEALRVSACRAQVGVTVDAGSISATLHDVDTRLANPSGFKADAVGLVGADHAAMFAAAARTRVASRLDDELGLWFVSTTARSLELAAATEAAFDGVYARPLELVAAHLPLPGNLARTRQVVADALLAYLATQDYVHSEFGRSLEQLAHEFRAMHVQSIREFREINTSESFPNAPTIDIYVGQWLGTHAEVSVDRTTGAATNVLVELD